MKVLLVIFLILVGVVLGIGIGYFVFMVGHGGKRSVKVAGTLMIPRREEELLKTIGQDLTIFIREPGKGSGNDIFLTQGEIFKSSYEGLNFGNTKNKTLWGASFKESIPKYKEYNCFIIPGEFVEGTVLCSCQRERGSTPEPCLINVELF